MPTINLKYYKDFTIWWFNTTLAAVTDLDTRKAKVLIDGGGKIMDSVFEEFNGFPKLKGNIFTLGIKLYDWAKDHQDPLEDARNIMEQLRKVYDK